MNTDEKLATIQNNFINGNLTDFKNALKKLTKKEIVYLIFLFQADGLEAGKILNYL